jgi:DNA-binding transcriptional LysR family regulator
MSFIATPLRGFLEVAEVGSISRAAARLHLSQPAVTKQMRALEQALAVRLVERTGRGVRLTKAGEVVASYGRQGTGLFQECRRALDALAAPNAGQLLIGAGVTTSVFQLPAWLRRLRQQRPLVDVTVRTGTSDVVEALVLAREVDVGLVTTTTAKAELRSRVLYREDIVLVAAADFPHARIELETASLILFPATTGFRRYLDQKLGADRLRRRVKMESDSVEAIKAFVAAGLGTSFLPITAVASELELGTLKRLRPHRIAKLRRSTSLVHRTDRTLSAAAQHFLRLAPS